MLFDLQQKSHTDEPGYYVPKQFGIRLENICFTKIVQLPHGEEGQNFLAIETITLVPYEPNLIQLDLLSNRQRDWLNKYHDKTQRIIGDELKLREAQGEAYAAEAYEWLLARTKPLPIMEAGSGAEAVLSLTTAGLFYFVIVVSSVVSF